MLPRRCRWRRRAFSKAATPLLPKSSPPWRKLGIDLSGHRSTQISPELVAASDVVLAMGRRHAREVVLLDGRAWDRTFTLKEFVRRGETVGAARLRRSARFVARPTPPRDANAPTSWACPGDDDVADPIGGPLAGYRKTARELGALVDEAASLLWVRRGIRTLPG